VKYLSYIFLFLTQYCVAQNILFNKSIELNPDIQHEGFTTVLVNDSGAIYGIGKTTNRYQNNKDSLVVVKMDKYGTYKWVRRYDVKPFTNELIKESVLLSDGSLVLGGTLQYYSSLNQNAFLLKLDSLGNEVWYQEYGDSYYQSIYDLKSTNDGGFIFGRSTDDPNITVGWNDAWIVKTDSLGNVEWDITLGDELWNEVTGIYEEEDSYKIFISTADENTLLEYIYEIDKNGNLLSETAYLEEDRNGTYGILSTTKGGYLILGIKPVTPYSLTNFDGYIYHIDSSGNHTWSLTVDEGISTQEWFYRGVELPDGSYMIAGSSHYNQLGSDTFRGWLVKVSKEGELLWSKIFEHDEDNTWEYFEDMALSPDGTVVIVGSTGQFPEEGQLGTVRNNMWVLKVDYDGNDWLPLTVEASIDTAFICVGDSLSLSTMAYNGRLCAYSNGTNCPYNGWWTGEGSTYLSDSFSSTPQFIGSATGTYDLTYHIIDQAGDTATTTVEIVVLGDGIINSTDTLLIGDSLLLMPTVVDSLLYSEWSGNGTAFLIDSTTFIAQDSGVFVLDFYYEYLDNCGETQRFEIVVLDSTIMTGISTISDVKPINLYPNPATNFVTLNNRLGEAAVITLYDTQGRPFYSQEIGEEAVSEIEIVDWENGSYFYTILTESGEKQTGKLIILK